MQHVNANDQPEAVKQFLLSLDVHAGSIVEIDGKVMHVSQHDPKLIASIQKAYDSRDEGRSLDEVAASIRSEFGFQGQQ
ncbi:MAG: hypothetical protein H8E66_13075 [Planctomycetes bacterium]|nr:hypothetical protein [Planctomycetota bacterium]